MKAKRLPTLEQSFASIFAPSNDDAEPSPPRRFVTLDTDGFPETIVYRKDRCFVFGAKHPRSGEPVPESTPIVEQEIDGGRWKTLAASVCN